MFLISISRQESALLIYEHLSPDKINELYFDDRKDYLSSFETIHYIHAKKNKNILKIFNTRLELTLTAPDY